MSLETALDKIHTRYGAGAIMLMGEDTHANVQTVTTGNMAIDRALGGGIPVGRVIEVFGPESSGKTTLALHVASETQKRGGKVAFIDAEHAVDPDYAEAIGVDVDAMYISQPDMGEQALDMALLLAESEEIDLIVIDSVAALTPRAELDGEIGDAHIGLQARLMSQALRKLAPILSRTDTTCIFINQLREKIGVRFGSPETTPGGRALKFYSSQRIDIRRIQTLKDKDEAQGNRTRIKIVKNKVASPFRQAEVDIIYGTGIDHLATIVDEATENKIIKKSGAWYKYGDVNIGQGKNNTKQTLKDNPELLQEIVDKLEQVEDE